MCEQFIKRSAIQPAASHHDTANLLRVMNVVEGIGI
jgi:hypothetical protein